MKYIKALCGRDFERKKRLEVQIGVSGIVCLWSRISRNFFEVGHGGAFGGIEGGSVGGEDQGGAAW